MRYHLSECPCADCHSSSNEVATNQTNVKRREDKAQMLMNYLNKKQQVLTQEKHNTNQVDHQVASSFSNIDRLIYSNKLNLHATNPTHTSD